MSDGFDSDSLLGELDKRLDDLFGKDERGSTPVDGVVVSPLDKLSGLMLAMNTEISEENITALKTEISNLENSYAGDTQVLALLKIMSLLVGYMKTKKPDGHRDTTTLLNSAFQCMQTVVENQIISTHEKIALISKEIENFNKFKAKIPSGRRPPRKKSDSRTGAGDLEPLSTAEPSSATLSLDGVFKALDALRSYLGEELDALKSGVKEGYTRSNDSRAHLIQELAALKGRMNSLSGLSEDLDRVRGKLAEEFTTLKRQVDIIKEEVSRFRDELHTVRSELEGLRGAAYQLNGASVDDVSAEDEAVIVEVEETPETPEVTDWGLAGPDSFVEGANSAVEHEQRQIHGEPITMDVPSRDREEAAIGSKPNETKAKKVCPSSGSYFLFQMGGRKYAVDEDNVIKASKADLRLLKKASNKGELTMIDCKRVFSGIKRGIEPAWNHLSSKDLEKTTFRLLTDDRIDGLLDTNGGGMLFLGSGSKRSVLFTDQPPKKKRLSRKDKVKRVSGSEYVYGAIQKSADSADDYLILDANQLCKRLRACIPAPFTKT